MSAATELKVNRSNTVAFIAANSTIITLTPQRRVRTSTGGFTIAPDAPRAPQTFRIIDISGSQSASEPPQRTIDGIERSVEFILLGAYDVVVEQFDIWTDASDSWEITKVFPDNGYERRATVVRRG